jgi:Rha family phage regulatory protein
VKDGKVWVSSLEIARLFGREHKHVLDAIRKLETSPDFTGSNLRPGSYRDPNNQERPMFMMTKKGYRRLTMDFQGAKATEIKDSVYFRSNHLA